MTRERWAWLLLLLVLVTLGHWLDARGLDGFDAVIIGACFYCGAQLARRSVRGALPGSGPRHVD